MSSGNGQFLLQVNIRKVLAYWIFSDLNISAVSIFTTQMNLKDCVNCLFKIMKQSIQPTDSAVFKKKITWTKTNSCINYSSNILTQQQNTDIVKTAQNFYLFFLLQSLIFTSCSYFLLVLFQSFFLLPLQIIRLVCILKVCESHLSWLSLCVESVSTCSSLFTHLPLLFPCLRFRQCSTFAGTARRS